jgi:mannose-6-phosphate isomerase
LESLSIRNADGVWPTLADARRRLEGWAATEAFPLWAEHGVDASGAFEEKLGDDGRPVASARRARVQPRQVFSFAHAARFGWDGPAGRIMREGFERFVSRYQRPDGLFRTLAGAAGQALDDQALLYDQAFVLLALAGGRDDIEGAEPRAVALRDVIERVWGHRSGGFLSGDKAPVPLLANPHMHLFEACLAWVEAGGDEGWKAVAARIAALALGRMVDEATGALHEAFDEDWSRAEGLAGRIIEPGHQFEWAWLLLRWAELGRDERAARVGLRLIEAGERGVDRTRNVAVLEMLDDGSVRAGVGRLWAQTERIKAGCLAGSVTGETRYFESAAAGCESVLGFLGAAPRGLWRDQMNDRGEFVVEATPASTFYHLVVAIDVLRGTVGRPLAPPLDPGKAEPSQSTV